MRRLLRLCAVASFAGATAAFAPFAGTPLRNKLSALCLSAGRSSGEVDEGTISRRDVIAVAATFAATAAAPCEASADIEGVVTPSGINEPNPAANAAPTQEGGVTLFKTKSGLKYIELREGSGPTPRYGQLVSISYKAYVKLPDIKGKPSKLEEFDSDRGYLIKHGNGRIVPGLDEGIHTMKLGGKRRIIVSPKLGYVEPGLGPIPEGPLARMRLNNLLDKMVEVRGGNVVFDVELRTVMDDEADLGYYGDSSISPEDFNTLRINVQSSMGSKAKEG